MANTRMLINADQPEVCRVVIVEDGKLEEYITEHATQELIKGNVYLGVITRVEPGIEAAFVDYGGKKYGFLPFKDVQRDSYRQTGERKARLRIQDVLFRGQRMLVQVVKEERDAKGPTLTNYITIPGRFLVLMNGSESTGVSRKIEDESERKKLKKLLSDLGVPENRGVIIRTAGLGRTKAELQKDLQMLQKIIDTIETTAQGNIEAPCLIYRGPDMVVRTVRDHFTADTQEILVDNVVSYRAIKDFFKLVMPRMQDRVKLYQDTKPLFSLYNIEEQIESIYSRRVPLPAGGSLVVDVGEALVAIDVNSGKTTGASELEETALRTNLEAAEEIGRQLRLRDQGGLIVIDFIDMMQKKNKSLVEKELKQAFKKDKARINISRISKFGLVEMSRQRMSSPVKEGVFERCRACGGSGQIKSPTTIALNVIRKIQEHVAGGKVKTLLAEVSTEIANYLLNNKMKYLLSLQEKHSIKIQFSSKDGLPYENFSYTIVERREERPFEAKPKEEISAEEGIGEGFEEEAETSDAGMGTVTALPEASAEERIKMQIQQQAATPLSGSASSILTAVEEQLATPAEGPFVEVRAVAGRSIELRPLENRVITYGPMERRPLETTGLGLESTAVEGKIEGKPEVGSQEKPKRRMPRGRQGRGGDPRKGHPRRSPGRRQTQDRGRRWRGRKPGQPNPGGKAGSPESREAGEGGFTPSSSATEREPAGTPSLPENVPSKPETENRSAGGQEQRSHGGAEDSSPLPHI